ncbi:C-X-C motif chemokine 10-like [Archocentrus centrarchus]|uniref:C-X-C motif chemokine 10-like n=1 Tax=Archocentrus centrarchus TaxID=63155 RepID=UPI0011EA334F|nr:C-X-C motif chemokine 10-like [Archocentrus centrarchus]
MKTSLAIQCIVLLACMAFCSSQITSKCWCLTISKSVNPSLITGVQEFGPRSYCSKREVVVTLKDGTKRCLDPEAKFTKAVLQRINQLKSGHKINASSKTTTAAPTAAPTAAHTAAHTAAPTAAHTAAHTAAPTAAPTLLQ